MKPSSGAYNANGHGYDQPNAPSFGDYVSVSRSAFIKGRFPVIAFPVPALGRDGALGRNTFGGSGLAHGHIAEHRGAIDARLFVTGRLILQAQGLAR
jgi:hypothetical protein